MLLWKAGFWGRLGLFAGTAGGLVLSVGCSENNLSRMGGIDYEYIEPPVAEAGPDQRVYLGEVVTLDASESVDLEDRVPLTFDWAMVASPAGSAMVLPDPIAETTSFLPDLPGSYVFQLTVGNTSGAWDETPDIVAITVVEAAEPVAQAGDDLIADFGTTVYLDGTASFDPAERYPLDYSWSVVSAPVEWTGALADRGFDTAWFVADSPGEYLFELTVMNEAELWDRTPDVVRVTVGDAPIDTPEGVVGPDLTVDEGELVRLDASSSYDPGGLSPLYFEWTLATAPPTSLTTLSHTASETTDFVADAPGLYVVELAVQNSAGVWDPTPEVIEIVAEEVPVVAPVADAGADVAVQVGELAALDATASYDPGGLEPLVFSWQTIARPAGSGAVLSSTSSDQPWLITDVAGIYTFELTVANAAGVWDATPDQVTTTAAAAPVDEPVAVAGPDVAVDVSETVTLDGTSSYDPAGLDPLAYAWSVTKRPSGSSAEPLSPTSGATDFIPDLAGTYKLALSVQNTAGVWDSTPDKVTITADALPVLEPIADAGADLVVTEGDSVVLDGSASHDPDGLDPLDYAWSLTSRPAGSAATLSAHTTATPSFVADVPGDYTLELSVRNTAGVWDYTPDEVSVLAEAAPIPQPIADAGADRALDVNETISLDGSASYDPSGLSPLGYSWRVTSQPAGSIVSLIASDTVAPLFTADTAGDYAVSLSVQNTAGVKDGTPDELWLRVQALPVLEPIADAGPDAIATVGDTVPLDGSASYDPDGLDPLVWAWTVSHRPPGSTASLSAAGSATPWFVPDVEGEYAFELSVQNTAGVWDSTPDGVHIHVDPGLADAPIADAGPDTDAMVDDIVTLDGTASYDPGGLTPLDYGWAVVSAPGAASVTGADTATPSFRPDVAGTWVFELTVTNTGGVSDPTPDVVAVQVWAGPTLSATPASLDFGSVELGCVEMSDLMLRNDGDMDLEIYSLTHVATGEIVLSHGLSLPVVLAPAETRMVSLTFAPTVDGAVDGTLTVDSNDPDSPLVAVQEGYGQLALVSDAFTAPVDPPVDVLIAVGQSGDMDLKSSILGDEAAAFLDTLESVTDNWHVGIVTKDDGCFNYGVLDNSTAAVEAKFRDAVGSGNGTSAAQDHTDALLALSGWALEEPSGCNAGFLRADAPLHIITVSDQEDESFRWWGDWLTLFESQVTDPNLLTVSAVADVYYDCGTGSDGYSDIAVATGGELVDICSGTWAPRVTDLASVSILGSLTYSLSTTADAATVEVFVDGTAWATGWRYLPGRNAVIFDLPPPPGATILVEYSEPGGC